MIVWGIIVIKKITKLEQLVYRRATEWLLRDYQAIQLMDPVSADTFEKDTNFIQGFVFRCLKYSANEILKKDLNGNDIGAHKYVTASALEKYSSDEKIPFIKEHVVCKNIYFTELINELKKDCPDEEKIYHMLLKFYFTALITEEENKILDEKGLRSAMTVDEPWAGENVFSRYECAGINLIENPHYILK